MVLILTDLNSVMKFNSIIRLFVKISHLHGVTLFGNSEALDERHFFSRLNLFCIHYCKPKPIRPIDHATTLIPDMKPLTTGIVWGEIPSFFIIRKMNGKLSPSIVQAYWFVKLQAY